MCLDMLLNVIMMGKQIRYQIRTAKDGSKHSGCPRMHCRCWSTRDEAQLNYKRVEYEHVLPYLKSAP